MSRHETYSRIALPTEPTVDDLRQAFEFLIARTPLARVHTLQLTTEDGETHLTIGGQTASPTTQE